MKNVKTAGMPHWLVALPLLHLLRGSAKPFETPAPGKSKYDLSWAGLRDILRDLKSEYMNSQQRR